MDGWTRATGEARELVEGVPSATSFTSPAPPHLTRKSPVRAQDDPLRAEIAQIMGEARSHAEREVLADPATSSGSEGGIRFLALGRQSGRGSSGVVLLATYAPEPQEAARCSEAVRYLCAAPATIAAMAGDGADGKDPQLRLSVPVEGVGSISIECGGPGGGAPPLVHVAVTAPWLGLGVGVGLGFGLGLGCYG